MLRKSDYKLNSSKYMEKSCNYYKQNKQACAKKRKLKYDLKKKYCYLNKKQILIKTKNIVAKKIKKNTRYFLNRILLNY